MKMFLKMLVCAVVLGTFNNVQSMEAQQIDENQNVIINNVASLQEQLGMVSESFDSLLQQLNSGDFVSYYKAASYFYRKITKKEKIYTIINSNNLEELLKIVKILSTMKDYSAYYNKLPYGKVARQLFDEILDINEEEEIIDNNSYRRRITKHQKRFKKAGKKLIKSKLKHKQDTIIDEINNIRTLIDYIDNKFSVLAKNDNVDIKVCNVKQEILKYLKDWLVNNQNNFLSSKLLRKGFNQQVTNEEVFTKKFDNILNEIFNNIWNTNFSNNKNEVLNSISVYLTNNNRTDTDISRAIHNFLKNIGNSLYNTVMTIKDSEFCNLFIRILKISEKHLDKICKYIVEDYCEDELIAFKDELKGENIYKKKRNYSSILEMNINRAQNNCITVFKNLVGIIASSQQIINTNDRLWALQLIDKYKTTITQLFNAEIKELKRDSLNYYIKYLYER